MTKPAETNNFLKRSKSLIKKSDSNEEVIPKKKLMRRSSTLMNTDEIIGRNLELDDGSNSSEITSLDSEEDGCCFVAED